jgi:hypothetical protein
VATNQVTLQVAASRGKQNKGLSGSFEEKKLQIFHINRIKPVQHRFRLKLIANADQVISETLDHRSGLACLNWRDVFSNEDCLLCLH